MKKSPASPLVSRRNFIRTVAVAAAVSPLIVPSRLLFGADTPNSRIRVGQIGCGRIATGHDLPGVASSGLGDVVAKSGRILQVGSQQRSWGPNEQFRKACECVRSGRVGNLKQVEIGLPTDPTAPDDPEQPVPSNLNYDLWLGPTPRVYYTEQ